MKKGFFRDNIEKIVRLLPRPMMNGKLIAKSRNFWLIVEEYGEEDGVVVLNKITDHGGKIPYDSIRKWQEPDMVILSAQVNVGKDGLFELNQFLDGSETEIMTEEEEILPERLKFVETALGQCPGEYIPVLKELLIRGTMEQGEIDGFCSTNGIPMGHKFFPIVSGRTSFLDVGERHKVWIKPVFVPVLEKLLLRPKVDTAITSSNLLNRREHPDIHLLPLQELLGLWFLVGLGCLRLGYRKFVNHRSSRSRKLKLEGS